MAWTDAARAAALEVRRRNLRLFHGTSSNTHKVTPRSASSSGRKVVYLSTDPKDAREFARQAVARHGGNPVVFMVRAKKQQRLKVLGQQRIVKRTSKIWLTTTKALENAIKLSSRRK